MVKDPIKRLIDELSLLPGIGERTALRLALHLIGQKKERVFSLAETLVEVAKNITECTLCCNLTAFSQICSICSQQNRDQSLICVVSSIQDLMAIEKSQSFRGLYHVLHGMLSPMEAIGPEKLRLKNLLTRLNMNNINEMVIATPATIEGEATALYIKEKAIDKVAKITRIATGVPVGGDLQYADRLSLARSLAMRQIIL